MNKLQKARIKELNRRHNRQYENLYGVYRGTSPAYRTRRKKKDSPLEDAVIMIVGAVFAYLIALLHFV